MIRSCDFLSFKSKSLTNESSLMNKDALHSNILGSVRFNDVKATRPSKINKGFNAQNNNFARAYSFWYISLPFLHDYDVKMPNFVFYEECKQATTKFYLAF